MEFLITKSKKFLPGVRDTTMTFGEIAAPDDCYLALRGLRSMAARMKQQSENAMKITRWLRQRPEVKQVLFPPLENDPGHYIWKRDFIGAASLFGLILNPVPEQAVARMIDDYRCFSIGASWGGFESLVIPVNPAEIRTAVPWTEEGFLLRYHIGLENPDDLITDLANGFARLKG